MVFLKLVYSNQHFFKRMFLFNKSLWHIEFHYYPSHSCGDRDPACPGLKAIFVFLLLFFYVFFFFFVLTIQKSALEQMNETELH